MAAYQSQRGPFVPLVLARVLSPQTQPMQQGLLRFLPQFSSFSPSPLRKHHRHWGLSEEWRKLKLPSFCTGIEEGVKKIDTLIDREVFGIPLVAEVKENASNKEKEGNGVWCSAATSFVILYIVLLLFLLSSFFFWW